MSLKDRFMAFVFLSNRELIIEQSDRSEDSADLGIDPFSDTWDDLDDVAERVGEKVCTNNDIFVNDKYYNEYLGYRWKELKDSKTDVKLMVSNEWNDFDFLLSVCDDLNLKPYFVLESTNGYYYDYVGVSKKDREELYSKQIDMLNKKKYDYIALNDKEYEPYFYCDVMHLGWKGWVYVTKSICEHYK